MKKGFGLIEVVAAAVVLGFLLVGLATLQKGNRDSIIRVRARDAANIVAQDIIDSLSALGSASVPAGTFTDIQRTRDFVGSPSRMLNNSINVPVTYNITVNVRPANDEQVVDSRTAFMEALGASNTLNVRHQLAKHVDINVNWDFKRSSQSINVSSVIR